ncbi:hypothetical protein GE061_003361 [Apolygus lucorum]|uniref:Uncharacterized protein n=1 Tax=Apolygus lucorum TaxID=248454 RepID=A0A8S9X3C1_APOLU|nr:hypothetical protein GE061_003361 [Apolygus lucorum]
MLVDKFAQLVSMVYQPACALEQEFIAATSVTKSIKSEPHCRDISDLNAGSSLNSSVICAHTRQSRKSISTHTWLSGTTQCSPPQNTLKTEYVSEL